MRTIVVGRSECGGDGRLCVSFFWDLERVTDFACFFWYVCALRFGLG